MHATPPAAAIAPTGLARRLVLGTAFLLGLALAAAPRVPDVHAQEPKPAAEAATKQPSTSRSVTISDRKGVATKIEIREEPKAGANADVAGSDASDAADATTDDDKGASRGRNITFGKHGRVVVNGLGGDREFDSFNDFIHDEPAIATMVVAIVAVVFLSPVLAIGLILWYRIRKTRMLNETMLKLAEKGVVPPAEALESLVGGKQPASMGQMVEQAKTIRRRAAWSDLRKGVIAGGVGLGLTAFSMLDDRSPNSIGLVLLFVGIGYVVLWWFEERQMAPSNGTTPGGGAGGPPSA